MGQPSLLGPRPPQAGVQQVVSPGTGMVFNRPPVDLRAMPPNTRPNFANVLPHMNLPGMQVGVT